MSLLPSVRGLPRAYWFLWTGSLVNRLGSFVVPFLALYLTAERHLPVDRAGLTVSLYGLGSLAAGPIGGHLADRVGRRATMVFGLALGAAAMLHLGFARAPLQIAAGAFLLGLCGDVYRPASSATIADIVPPADRLRAYALHHWAVNLGFSIAPVVAGVMAHRGFTWLFIGDAVTTLACAGLVWIGVPESKPTRDTTQKRTHAALEWLTPLRDRAFGPFVLVSFGIAMMFHQGYVALPLDMTAHGISESQFGMLIALNGAMIVFLQPFAITFVQRFRRASVLALGALFVGLGFGLTGLASSIPLYAASIALWTIGEIVMTPLVPALIADLSPEHLRATYQGAHHLAWGTSSFVAPALGSAVLARFGSPVLWGGCLVIGIAAALGQLAIGRAHDRAVGARTI